MFEGSSLRVVCNINRDVKTSPLRAAGICNAVKNPPSFSFRRLSASVPLFA